MFNGMIDPREVQRGSSSQSSGGSSSRQRRTTSDMEIQRLQQELEKRDAFLKAQEEFQRQQQAHQEHLHATQMAAIQVSMKVNNYHSYHYQIMLLTCYILQAMYQMQGHTFVMPEVRPPPVPPQWGMFANMPFSPAAQVQFAQLCQNLTL